MFLRTVRHMSVAFILVGFATAVSAREFPLGTYQSRLGGDEKSNQWQLEFGKEGRYVLFVNGNALQPIEKGDFKVKRGTIELDDGTGLPKLYRWTIDHKQLRLRLISEPRRVGDVHLTQGPWDKLGDPLPVDPLDAINTGSLPGDLIEWSTHHNPEFRQIAAERLSEQGEAALPLLVSLLNDESPFVAEKAAASLARLGATAKPAKAALLDVAQNESGWLALYATEAVMKIDPQSDQIEPALKRLMADRNWYVRIAATIMLRDARPDQIPAVVKSLSALAATDESHGRSRVAEELAKCGSTIDPEGIATLRTLLGDQDEFVRGNAAQAAGKLALTAKDTVPELIKLLDDENSVVRTDAVVALGEIGPAANDSVPKLVQIMSERSYLEEGVAAKTALGKINPGELAAIERRPYLIGGGIAAILLLATVWFLRGRRKARPTA
jgi:HEAT repeat protein